MLAVTHGYCAQFGCVDAYQKKAIDSIPEHLPRTSRR